MSRVQEITVAILRKLAEWDAPADEAVLHAAIDARMQPTVAYTELADALRLLEQGRYVNRFNNLRGPRWAITDKGRAELHA